MNSFGFISNAAATLCFAVVAILMVPGWQRKLLGTLLIGATVISAIWLGTLSYYYYSGSMPLQIPQLIELLRDLAWFGFLSALLATKAQHRRSAIYAKGMFGGVTVICLFIAYLISINPATGWLIPRALIDSNFIYFGYLLIALLGLVLVEHLYRNTRAERKWTIKFLCLGIGALFAYDFYLYSSAVLFRALDPSIFAARGIINMLAVPLIAIAAARNPQWKLDLFVSRQVVFHSTAVFAAGVYLLLMAAAGYYIRAYGGTWGRALEVAFFAGALLLLALLVFSGQLRSRLKVFLAKHFYSNKYEYREEWLKFTATLSEDDSSGLQVRKNVIRAIANIIESPAGRLWEADESRCFVSTANWNFEAGDNASEAPDSPLVQFLQRAGWVINLDEYRDDPQRYTGLVLPEWLAASRQAWLVVPLIQRECLLGFIVLAHSRAALSFNWEDSDLLKTVGRQTASYLALLEATEALARARQFEAFNRLSAFVVHDLKNLAAQLSLVVTNAKRHMNNPEFMQDAINTVENSVSKMNKMLQHLRKGGESENRAEMVALEGLLKEVVANRSGSKPVPTLEVQSGPAVVLADRDRLASVMEHIVQNAQEATPEHGHVKLRVDSADGTTEIRIEDDGCGMDAAFVRDRLFVPFDTTKGNAGMGIGVFESREVVRMLGGDIEVQSTPNVGTTFLIRLPAVRPGGAEGDAAGFVEAV